MLKLPNNIQRDIKGRFISNNEKLWKFDKELIAYFKREGDISRFVNSFWGISLTEKDLIDLKLFSEVVKLVLQGLSPNKISKRVGFPKGKIEKWIYKINLPPAVRLTKYYINQKTMLDEQKKLLSINSTKGGLLTGPWLCVPEKISKYNDLLKVIDAISPLPIALKIASEFKIDSIENYKPSFFAYLLGVLVGDSRKTGIKRNNRTTRRMGLSLTKKEISNLMFGKFVVLCSNSLGLRMKRTKDEKPGKRNKNPFFRWSSQCSSLIEWVYNVCLGLNDDQVTTYDPIKADWILTAPRDFKIWFLQGVADSDGFIDVGVSQVGIVTGPNTDFIENILKTLKIHTRKKFLHRGKLGVVMIKTKDAYKLPVFNPFVRSYRYQLLEGIVKARRFNHHWPDWLIQKIHKLSDNGLSEVEIIKKLVNEYSIFITRKNLHRRLIRCKSDVKK